MRYPFVSTLLQEIGTNLGITVELEPEYGFAGELIFANGRRMLFRNFNINPAGANEIARDKAYTSYFLRKHGFQVPEGKAFFAPRLNQNLAPARRRGTEQARAYAAELGLPVFIKPNDLSQGEGVTKVYQLDDITALAEAIFARSDVLLIERACSGRDYRVVVLDDTAHIAYERRPLAVTGDGQQTISELLLAAQSALAASQRANSTINPLDPRIDIKLTAQGLTRASVLPAGQTTHLLDNANLSTGGSTVDLSATIHPSFAAIAVAATRSLGLRMAGVDILCDDLCQSAEGQTWHIIEMNAAPGIDNYAALGAEQMARVRALYQQVLRLLAA